jgi:predicted nucleic acid-binding protein
MLLASKTSFAGIEITATASDVVLDASAIVRALVDYEPDAVDWLERIAREDVLATCPELVYAEVASAVLRLHRGGALTLTEAQEVVDTAVSAPFATEAVADLVGPAIRVAVERGLSAYDACYVVLAETLGATLITADRRLAAATTDAVLITG